jgi:hypothetical protein
MPGAEKPVQLVTIKCVISERSSSARGFVHLHTDCGAGERAPDRGAVAVDCPTARIVGRCKAGKAMFDAGETDHSLEERKALGIVFKQRSSIAEEELMHVVFWNGRFNAVQIRLRVQNCSDNEPNRVS